MAWPNKLPYPSVFFCAIIMQEGMCKNAGDYEQDL